MGLGLALTELPLAEVLSVVLLLVSLYLGTRWKRAKRVLEEVAEALTTLSDAVKDNDVSEEELRDVVDEFKDVIEAARGV